MKTKISVLKLLIQYGAVENLENAKQNIIEDVNQFADEIAKYDDGCLSYYPPFADCESLEEVYEEFRDFYIEPEFPESIRNEFFGDRRQFTKENGCNAKTICLSYSDRCSTGYFFSRTFTETQKNTLIAAVIIGAVCSYDVYKFLAEYKNILSIGIYLSKSDISKTKQVEIINSILPRQGYHEFKLQSIESAIISTYERAPKRFHDCFPGQPLKPRRYPEHLSWGLDEMLEP